MKKAVEHTPELLKLSSYFQKIETIAERLGIDVDELIRDKSTRTSSMYTSFKKNVLAMAQKRAEILSNQAKNVSNNDSSIVDLTIIVNKDNRREK